MMDKRSFCPSSRPERVATGRTRGTLALKAREAPLLQDNIVTLSEAGKSLSPT
jgi:hypothetical protein